MRSHRNVDCTRLSFYLGLLVKQVIGIAVLLEVAYFFVQKYGDTTTRRMVNDLL